MVDILQDTFTTTLLAVSGAGLCTTEKKKIALDVGDQIKVANIAATQTSLSQSWMTPLWLFDALNEEFHFDIDVCADENNTLCDKWFDEEQDGLKQKWEGVCWCNPPYRDAKLWLKKAYEEAKAGNCIAVLLIGARTDTRYWFDYARYGEVRFIKGRLKFDSESGSKNSAPFPSAIVTFVRGMKEEPKTIYWDIKEITK